MRDVHRCNIPTVKRDGTLKLTSANNADVSFSTFRPKINHESNRNRAACRRLARADKSKNDLQVCTINRRKNERWTSKVQNLKSLLWTRPIILASPDVWRFRITSDAYSRISGTQVRSRGFSKNSKS